MRSPHASLPEDIRTWAYQEDALEPVQDWDIILSWNPIDLYLDLAEDPNCPSQLYFLKLLYLIVGNSVRQNFRDRSKDDLREFIQRGTSNSPYCIHLWARRSLQLLQNPTQFVYADWCAGKLAMMPE